MILADTSVWVEFLKTKKPVFPVLRELIERGNLIAMECIFGELLQGARTKREKNVIQDYWKYIPKRDENGIWIEAGSFSAENSLINKGIGLIDSAIICFARKHNTKVWSLDKKLISILKNDEIFTVS
jgi:predicted nucleic acid-binding protein